MVVAANDIYSDLNMEPNMKTLHVELGQRSYDIFIENCSLGLAGQVLSTLNQRKNLTIITNTTIAPLYLEALKISLHAHGFNTNEIILPDGEQFKTLDSMRAIYEQLLGFGLDRSSTLIALGGGVIGDMTGFAAATFMRGIPFVQIPTTLLAQVDSSVGGKTGVNLPGGKNMVGSFYQPVAVIVDPQVLGTLPARELRAGMAEVIKYGIINDSEFFSFLESNMSSILQLNAESISQVITQCCRIKADIISQDETEQGIRAHLNFGHTLGHAVETLTGYSKYLHGEAVAIGMQAAALLSQSLGFCSADDVKRIEALITDAGLPVTAPSFKAADCMHAMLKDKKKSGSTLNFVLVKQIGEVFLQPVLQDQLQRLLVSDSTFCE
jgi:3-dehydroquinate synthase